MKKQWTRPEVMVENFVPNEYVAACYDYNVELSCAIPGTAYNKVDDYGTKWNTINRNGADGKLHGLCANMSTTMKVSGSAGYETVNGVAQKDRPITNIVIGQACKDWKNDTYSSNAGTNSSMNDGYYHATWKSYDGANMTGAYSHYGVAHVTSAIQIEGRPNHS